MRFDSLFVVAAACISFVFSKELSEDDLKKIQSNLAADAILTSTFLIGMPAIVKSILGGDGDAMHSISTKRPPFGVGIATSSSNQPAFPSWSFGAPTEVAPTIWPNIWNVNVNVRGSTRWPIWWTTTEHSNWENNRRTTQTPPWQVTTKEPWLTGRYTTWQRPWTIDNEWLKPGPTSYNSQRERTTTPYSSNNNFGSFNNDNAGERIDTTDAINEIITSFNRGNGRNPNSFVRVPNPQASVGEATEAGKLPLSSMSENDRNAYFVACETGDVSNVEQLLSEISHLANLRNGESGFKLTCLHYAAKYGHRELLERLLAIPGIDVDAYSYSDEEVPFYWCPLHYAIASGNIDIIRLLINAKARADQISSLDSARNPTFYSQSILDYAICCYEGENGREEVIQLLKRGGATCYSYTKPDAWYYNKAGLELC